MPSHRSLQVDIMTIDKVTAYSSGEEDELWFIPIVFDEASLPAPSPQGTSPHLGGCAVVALLTTRSVAHHTTAAAYEGEGVAVPAPAPQ
jgi:hypothetical protein